MGVWRFRMLVGGLALANLVAASPAGAMLGFVMLMGSLAALLPYLGMPQEWVLAMAGLVGLPFMVGGAYCLYRGRMASNAGDHASARGIAAKGMLLASVPSVFVLSIFSFKEALPG